MLKNLVKNYFNKPSDNSKFCNSCRTFKDIICYYKHPANKDKLTTKCKECLKNYQISYNKANADARRSYGKRRYQQDPIKRINKVLQHAKENPSLYANRAMARYAAKLQRTPKWLTQEQKAQIKWAYDRAAAYTAFSGIKYEVDHIIPLQGENVSGLHVPWNLQILTKSENVSKGNRCA